MKIQNIEQEFNTDEFKSKVVSLFSKEVASKIDFDFKIVVSRFGGELIKVSVYDNSYDVEGISIPKLFAITSEGVNTKRIQKEVISQFKNMVSIF